MTVEHGEQDVEHGEVGELDDEAGVGAHLVGADLAYARIRAAIVEGEFGPGTRLVEQRIGEMFDLSRTPVREALRRLEAEGLVVSERNRGAMVPPVAVEDLLDAYELRSRLECYAAEMAAERMRPADIRVLRAAVDRFSRVATSGDDDDHLERVRRLTAANHDVHDLIVSGARHSRLGAMLWRSVDVPLVFQAFSHFGTEELQRSDLFHHLIAEAIARREGTRAGQLMLEHVLQGRDVLLASQVATPEPPEADTA